MNVQMQLREAAQTAHGHTLIQAAISGQPLTKSELEALTDAVKAVQAAYRKAECAGWTCHPYVTSELDDLSAACRQAIMSAHAIHKIVIDRSHIEYGGPEYLVLQAV